MTGSQLTPAANHGAGDRPLDEPTPAQRRQVLVIGGLILVTTVTTTLAAFANPPADEWLSGVIRDGAWIDALAWLEVAGTPPFLAGLAALLLLGWRCRTFLVVAAGALAAGVLSGWLMTLVVGRDRPVESPVPGSDSYPSVSVLLLTVLAGLVPMALESLTRSVVVRHVATAALGLLAVGTALAQAHAGLHWPLDVVGAALVGAGVVVCARVLLEEPSRHPWCRTCLWLERGAGTNAVGPTVIDVAPHRARVLHRVTSLWTAGLVVAFLVLALTRGVPRSPESGVMGSGLEVPLQWGLLAVIVCGVLLARRWHLAGALLVAFGAGLLGYAASVQYSPAIAVTITGAAWVPALLLWLEWHRHTTLRAALVAAVVTSVVLGGVVTVAATTYAAYWGPTHPPSATAAADMGLVEWMWSGGVTPTGAAFRLRTTADADMVRLLVSESEDLSSPVAVADTRPDEDRVADLHVGGLQPDTRYYYAAEVDGEVDRDRVQTFRTFPRGPASFSFVLGSCQIGGSNGRVFDAMRAVDPLFVLAMGDWTYGNVDENDPAQFRAQYDLNLVAPAQAALYAQAPIAYVWGDHDFGGNDSDRTAESRPAAMQVYRQMTPHYPLASDPQAAIYQAFTVGRVRFLVTDSRAARDPVDDPSGEFRSALGAQQRAWLLGELARADEYGLVVWVNPDPWVADASPGSDTWAGFAEERQLVADAIADRDVDNLLMVSGDAHMLAFDDGTNTDFSTSQGGGFPLFHAAAVDRPGSTKGGPYSGPVIPGGGQFGTVEIRDDGAALEVTLSGWTWESRRLFTEVLQFPAAS
ncbi:MAG TPA: alkaline phosphatase D family protein [Jiangellaceae bacterium]|nr:alkaline phosphatase D family protein [Jiangellaceae bacterium]